MKSDYPTLKKIFYKEKALYESEINCRRDGMYSIHFPIDIHGNPSFMVTVPALLNDISLVYKDTKKLDLQLSKLPSVARDQYLESCLFDEIILTNNIEGVYSTRREVMDAYEQIGNTNTGEKALRFSGLIDKYSKLSSHEHISLESSQDIRTLYNEIILPEIDKKNLPDGIYYRSGAVDVVAPTQKIKHQGVYGEGLIIQSMDNTLSILKNDNIPPLIKIAAIHYFIDYIHPFYDGNGRLDRFISSYLLSKELSPMVAYRLSYVIKDNKKKYYDAFDECNDQKNAGDITPFVLMFIDLVKQSIKHVLHVTEEGIQQLKLYFELLNSLDLSSLDTELIFYFIQNALFTDDPFTLSKLSTLLRKSSSSTNRYITNLMENGFPIIKEKQGKKYVYTFDLDVFQKIVSQRNIHKEKN